MAGWTPALRLARRDAWRHKGRSLLVLVMIALPVLAVSAADVVYNTAQLDGVESLDRRLGAADARITVDVGAGGQAVQAFDPEDGSGFTGDEDAEPVTPETIRSVLGRDVPITARPNDWDLRVDTERGLVYAEGFELDAESPLVEGLYDLTDGRWATVDGEVVVSPELASKGFPVGSELAVHDGATFTVVGTAESTSYRDNSFLIGAPGGLDIEPAHGMTTWFVGGGPVSWDDVLALNQVGATVLSRAVVENPPPDSELPAEVREWQGYVDNSWIAVVALVVVMALLELSLLAGPAFAVGARRQSRTLALMAASGGTPKQARRVILAGGVVLGGVAAVIGVLLGVLVGWAVLPIVQHFSGEWLGPFDVSPWQLAVVALFGLVSAFLAAVVPAWIASRQDVVAVLAGRRGDRKPSFRSPLVGLVLVGLGIAGSVVGAGAGGGEVTIAGSAVLAVLGMILLTPVVLAVLARLGRRLPLVARYAIRDASRHRTRTVPAVAAVAATVAGVVALGIANSSDAAQSEATYQPLLAEGMGSLSVSAADADWPRYEDAIRREAPQVGLARVTSYDAFNEDSWTDVQLRQPGAEEVESLLDMYVGSFGTVLVGTEGLDLANPMHDDDLDDAQRMLDRGGIVVFTSHPVDGDEIRVSGSVHGPDGEVQRELTPAVLPAYFLQLKGSGPAMAVAAEGSLDATGLEVATAGLLLDAHDLSEQQEESLQEVIQGIDLNAYLYVERGYQNDDETLILLGILFSLGAILMLGGTLTATFLALSDARPDLATLSAVGAAPRTRRGVAAAYALVVGFVGATLGAAVGFIPGIAVTYPLTSVSWGGVVDAEGNALPSHFVDVPWLFVLGLVVALPIVTSAIVGLTARSRLPLVARLD